MVLPSTNWKEALLQPLESWMAAKLSVAASTVIQAKVQPIIK
jgi:hypothetical protein